MKAVAIILIAVAAMALLGWITFSSSGDRPSVSVETEVIRRDVGKAAEATERAAEEAAAGGEKLIDEARRTDVDVDVRREPADAGP